MYKEKKIYLEDGDARGGLEHIMQNHGHDFERKLGVSGNQAVADKKKKAGSSMVTGVLTGSRKIQEVILPLPMKWMRSSIFL